MFIVFFAFLKLVFQFFQLKVVHFLNVTTTCKMDHTVGVYQILKLFSHSLLDFNKLISLCLIIEVRAENFLAASRVVAMACADYKQKEFLAWFIFCFFYKLIYRCQIVFICWV